jgi:GalNAc-alpha-(1->4)-GalNAc-alpha-(1->3)-diNAcBac-PP-undecaprenol alpha-1,4-N-acetyl-D-galactosaminyltransferase
MKIMLLVSSMHGGGAERVAATLVNAWAARGDTVTLVPTYSGRGSCFYSLSDQVRLIWLADRPGGGAGMGGRGPWRGVSRLRALRGLIREHAPDVLVSFLTNVNVAALLAARGLGIPVIVSERTDPAASSAAGPALRLLRRLLYSRADTVVMQTQEALIGFKALLPGLRQVAVIPNPLPEELVAGKHGVKAIAPKVAASDARTVAAPVEMGQAEPRSRLAAMGRLIAHKQFDLLVDVFARLAGDFPDWDLWIWGDGPDRAALQKRVAAAGLDDRVRLPGRTLKPWHELAAAQAFVLSSSVEGFPNTLLEAMALGLACAAFDCPSGPRALTEHGRAALLVPAGDRAALEAALRQLLADSALRVSLGAKAAASVRDRFGLPAVLARWDAVFAQARRRHGTLPPVAQGLP